MEPSEQLIQLAIWFFSMAGVIMVAALILIIYNIYAMRNQEKHNKKHL